MEPLIGQPPQLTWRADGVPIAPSFGDAYFGSANALHEIAHVFLNGTGLWQKLVASPSNVPLQIGETGFGTGLNFCAAVQLWRACQQAGVSVPPLHFTSIEAWPLTQADLAQALAPFAAIKEIAVPLIAAWPESFTQGELFTASLFEGQVQLSLKVDEAEAALKNITVPGGVDVWFLDGFSPDQNPAMWQPEIMAAIAGLSAPGARLASFTAAGHVRRALEGAGFNARRVKGFGRKRHMTVAEFSKSKIRPKAPGCPKAQLALPARIAIIGGGLAGHVLADRAHHHLPTAQITLFDDDFSGSSTPPIATLVPRLDVGHEAHSWLMPESFNSATRYWDGLAARADDPAIFRQLGALYHPRDAAARNRAQQAAASMGGEITEDGHVFWPQAGIINTARAFQAIQQLSGAMCERGHISDLAEIAKDYDHVILANGAGVSAFLPPQIMPLSGRAGALAKFEVGMVPHSILFGEGHVLPADPNHIYTGASFHHWPLAGPKPTGQDLPGGESEDRLRIEKLMGQNPQGPMIDRWVGLRVMTPDQLPIVGPLPNWRQLAKAIGGLRHGQWLDQSAMQAAFAASEGAQMHLLAGLGARGFLWAPLIADRVIRGLAGRTLNGSEAVLQNVAPWRFLLREERYSRLEAVEDLPSGPILRS